MSSEADDILDIWKALVGWGDMMNYDHQHPEDGVDVTGVHDHILNHDVLAGDCVCRSDVMIPIGTRGSHNAGMRGFDNLWGSKIFQEKRHFAIFCGILKTNLGWTDRDIGKWFGPQAIYHFAVSLARAETSVVYKVFSDLEDNMPLDDLYELYSRVCIVVVGKGQIGIGGSGGGDRTIVEAINVASSGTTVGERERLMFSILFEIYDSDAQLSSIVGVVKEFLFEVLNRLIVVKRAIKIEAKIGKDIVSTAEKAPVKRMLDI